jgi:hypothetical protein
MIFNGFSWISLASFRICSLLFILTMVGSMIIACDRPDTTIYVAMDDKAPPTFSFSGPWWAIKFEVTELSDEDPTPANKYTVDDRPVWTISLPEGRRVKSWPKVTYGMIPEGFSQTLPSGGTPPELVEGKRCVAQALDTSRSGGAIYFIIRNGKLISAPEASLLK